MITQSKRLLSWRLQGGRSTTPDIIREWIRNIDIFLARWETIPEENVAPRLGVWVLGYPSKKADCGIIACAGGWLPNMPEFAAMGVRSDDFGAPILGDQTRSQVSRQLFGSTYVFFPRHAVDGPSSITDKQVVINRFTKLRAWHVAALGAQA